MTATKTLADLRSRRWFADADMRALRAPPAHAADGPAPRGRDRAADASRIINTWSDLSPCHAHLRERAEAVKRGVLMAGGLPFELPAMSLGEVMVKPTTMLYRNFLAMEVEELLRSLPDRRRGAAGRLRQDHAGHGDGRDQHGHADDLLPRRADAERPLPQARRAPSARSAPARTRACSGTSTRPARSARPSGSSSRRT